MKAAVSGQGRTGVAFAKHTVGMPRVMQAYGMMTLGGFRSDRGRRFHALDRYGLSPERPIVVGT